MKDQITIDLTFLKKAWDNLSHANLKINFPYKVWKTIVSFFRRLYDRFSKSHKSTLTELDKAKCSIHYNKSVSSIDSVGLGFNHDPVLELQSCWYLVQMFREKYPREIVMYNMLRSKYWNKYDGLGLFDTDEFLTQEIKA